MDKRRIIEKFNDLINDDVRQCIEQDISFDELSSYNRILILQSANILSLRKLISNINQTNLTGDIVIIGQGKCKEVVDEFFNRNIYLIEHNKRFDLDDLVTINDIRKIYNIDAVLYLNSYVNSTNYINVEKLLIEFEDEVSIYSYSYGQHELNRHKKVARHMYGCILYKSIVEWFGAWQCGE